MQAAHLSSLPAVTITVAPSALASWIAVTPMPLVPPCTSSVSPGCRRARSNTFDQTVKKVSGRLAASTSLKPGRHRQALADGRDADTRRSRHRRPARRPGRRAEAGRGHRVRIARRRSRRRPRGPAGRTHPAAPGTRPCAAARRAG